MVAGVVSLPDRKLSDNNVCRTATCYELGMLNKCDISHMGARGVFLIVHTRCVSASKVDKEDYGQSHVDR